MDRDGLRDDEWDRIKDFLPGREGHVGGTAPDNRLFVDLVLVTDGHARPSTRLRGAKKGATTRPSDALGRSGKQYPCARRRLGQSGQVQSGQATSGHVHDV